MSLIEAVENGRIVNTTKATEAARNAIGDSGTTVTTNTTFDKEMFLKLLAAEMQYQDPLEPSSNSDYVSQMASFSQVEATTNVSNTVDAMSANSMIGKYVTVSTDDGKITGIVDYVSINDDKYYLSINDKLYSAEDVVTVQDATYYEAGVAASALTNMVSNLPNEDYLSLSDEESLSNATTVYNSFSDYTKSFLSSSVVEKLETLNKRMELLKKAAE